MRRRVLTGARVIVTSVVLLGAVAFGIWGGTGTHDEDVDRAPPDPVVSEATSRADRPHVAAGERGAELPGESGIEWTLSGTVSDPDGAPIEGARIELRRPADGPAPGWDAPILLTPEVLAATSTDAEGWYEIDTNETERLAVRATCEGFVPYALALRGIKGQDLELEWGTKRTYLVVDPAGDPVPEAEIWPEEASIPQGFVVTDASGLASFVPSPYESPTVRARGYAATDAPLAAEVPEGETIRVELREGRTVAGHVVDQSGAPLRDIPVTLQRETVLSGPSGEFEFVGMVASDPQYGEEDGLWLRAVGEGLCGGEHVDVWPGDRSVRVVLRKTATISGIVVDETGAPVPGAEVRNRVVTDADGRFTLLDFSSGRELIWADKKGAAPGVPRLGGSEWVTVEPGGVAEDVRIVVRAELESFVRVRVLDAQGSPVPRADVKAWADGEEVGDNRTSDEGMYLVKLRKPSGTLVTVAAATRGDPGLDAMSSVPVESGATKPLPLVELRLGEPGRLHVRLVGPDGAEVPLDPAYLDGPDHSTRATDGSWPLASVDQFYGLLEIPGFARQTVMFNPPHDRPRREEIRLLPASRVRGRVVSADGTPAPDTMNVVILTFDESTEEWLWGDAGLDEDGRFDISGMPPGRTVMRVFEVNDVRHYGEFTIPAGAEVDLGVVTLTPPRSVETRIVAPGGEGIGGAVVRYWDAGNREIGEAATTRADGMIRSKLPASFPVAIQVTRPGRATHFALLESGAAAQRIVLGAPGSVRVIDDLDIPMRDWMLEVRIPGTKWSWVPRELDDDSDEDGDLLGDLPAGPLDVILWVDGKAYSRQVEIIAGRTVTCVIDE